MTQRVLEILINAFWRILLPGIKVTLPLTFFSFALAFVISVIVALIQYADVKILKQICRFYIWFIRGTPLLVQLYVVYYGLPQIGIKLEAVPAAILTFGFNEGAYMAESMRGALEAVPKGQIEAGYCVGMSYLQIIRRIVLPQALRTAFPSLSNSLISMVKGTSLASVITITEMFRQAQIINAIYYEPLWLYLEAAMFYLLFCSVITLIQRAGEKKLSTYGGVK
ncbi:MAG: amino acid ABC transporter permease [Erysipelotrichaceae bacterium]|nr:amino acid ABC transporter permease [Erysipelotrichaceae bacterium]MBR2746004.1 amino acid ABC transporter permease [Erysipelotrichaceae bacterium]